MFSCLQVSIWRPDEVPCNGNGGDSLGLLILLWPPRRRRNRCYEYGKNASNKLKIKLQPSSCSPSPLSEDLRSLRYQVPDGWCSSKLRAPAPVKMLIHRKESLRGVVQRRLQYVATAEPTVRDPRPIAQKQYRTSG